MSTGNPQDNNQGRSPQQPVGNDRVGWGEIGCGLFGFLLLAACCGGVFSCVHYDSVRSIQRVVNHNKPFVDANDGQVKILWVYPRHGHKGQFNGHYAVVEGIKTKERREISVHPGLPVPEEIWQIELAGNGHYIFKSKIK